MKLFEPIVINGMELRNRICQAPILEAPGVQSKQQVNEDTVEWYACRARGGAGFVMSGCMFPYQMQIPAIVEGLPRVVEEIHKYGGKFGVQFGMWGPLANLGPSAGPFPDEDGAKLVFSEYFKTEKQRAETPPGVMHVLTVEELLHWEEQFAEGARILKECGVDCIELHCSHGGATLMCAFISPFYNRREDDYGGSWENRLRFPTETVRKMREAVGPDYPLLARIDANELLGDRGITPRDAADYIAPAMEDAGIDCLDVSQGSIMHSPQGILTPMYYEEGCFLDYAETVKKGTRLPVIGVGRLVDLDMCEEALQAGRVDLVHFGRQLIADPETPNKYLAGKKDEIRQCIGCNEGCGLPCAVNYDIGPDRLPLLPAGSAKKIVVIGAGVAGMEAARVAALRGYSVTLLEKRESLGGLVGTLKNEPTCRDLSKLTDFLMLQMEKRGVDVRLGFDATADAVLQLAPDVVIIAAGAVQDIPDRLAGNPKALDILEAIRVRDTLGKKIVIWGQTYGSETAISLAEEGHEVTLMGNGTRLSVLGFASNARRWWLMKKLSDVDPIRLEDSERAEGVDVFYQSRLGDVREDTLDIVLHDGTTRTVEYDNLIVARARKRERSLEEALGDQVELYTIGDYAQVNVIQKAIFAANEVVRSLDRDEEQVDQLTQEPEAAM